MGEFPKEARKKGVRGRKKDGSEVRRGGNECGKFTFSLVFERCRSKQMNEEAL